MNRYDIALGKLPATIDNGQELAYKDYQKSRPVATYRMEEPPQSMLDQDVWAGRELSSLRALEQLIRQQQSMLGISHPTFVLDRQQVAELGFAMPNPYPTPMTGMADSQ